MDAMLKQRSLDDLLPTAPTLPADLAAQAAALGLAVAWHDGGEWWDTGWRAWWPGEDPGAMFGFDEAQLREWLIAAPGLLHESEAQP